MKITKQTRGVRNNNFGNIRKSFPLWKGELRVSDSPEHQFCVFKSYEYGICALYKLLCTYIRKYGLNTVPEIINRYAPSSENNTRNYIQFVDDRQPFPQVSTDGLSILYLMSAICEYESEVEISPEEIRVILVNFGLMQPLQRDLFASKPSVKVVETDLSMSDILNGNKYV